MMYHCFDHGFRIVRFCDILYDINPLISADIGVDMTYIADIEVHY